jgi:hypothetical protein
MVVAAWFRAPGGIAAGLLIIVAAWSHGLIWFRRNQRQAAASVRRSGSLAP